MNWIIDWPYKWFAPFLPERCGKSAPHWLAFVDKTWVYTDRVRLAEYLAAAPVVLITDAEEGRCYFCGSDLGNASCLRSDGIWLWENGLDHYVLEHAIRLPDTFVAHIEEREFRPPAEVHDDFEFLPMPTGAEVQGLLHLE